MPIGLTTLANDYGTDIPRWKTDLILLRAMRVGFRRDELAEVQQELAPVVTGFVFDPDRSNGACERTVLIAVIDRQLQRLLRTRARYQRAIAAVRVESDRAMARRPELAESSAIAQRDLADDVTACLGRLDAQARAICLGLSRGESALAIRQRLALSRRELEAAMRRIQAVFQALGMDAWV